MQHNYPDKGAYLPTPEVIAAEAARIKTAKIEAMRDAFYKPLYREGKPHTATVRVVRPGKIGLES